MAAVCRFAAGLALVGVTSMAAMGADFEQPIETGDWYVSLGVAPAPDIEEKGSGPSGQSTYTWDGVADNLGPRLAVGYLACSGGVNGGLALGIEGVLTTCEVTPNAYKVGGLKFPNTSNNTLRYSTAGVTVFGGYEYGINADNDSISPFLVIGPFLGLGAAYADSELPSQGNTYEKGSGVGWYLEGGLRAGFFVTEKRWIGGIVVDLVYSTGEVDIDYSDGRSSTVTHERSGVGGALVIGYRP
jgi:hypothetical protein